MKQPLLRNDSARSHINARISERLTTRVSPLRITQRAASTPPPPTGWRLPIFMSFPNRKTSWRESPRVGLSDYQTNTAV